MDASAPGHPPLSSISRIQPLRANGATGKPVSIQVAVLGTQLFSKGGLECVARPNCQGAEFEQIGAQIEGAITIITMAATALCRCSFSRGCPAGSLPALFSSLANALPALKNAATPKRVLKRLRAAWPNTHIVALRWPRRPSRVDATGTGYAIHRSSSVCPAMPSLSPLAKPYLEEARNLHAARGELARLKSPDRTPRHAHLPRPGLRRQDLAQSVPGRPQGGGHGARGQP